MCGGADSARLIFIGSLTGAAVAAAVKLQSWANNITFHIAANLGNTAEQLNKPEILEPW